MSTSETESGGYTTDFDIVTIVEDAALAEQSRVDDTIGIKDVKQWVSVLFTEKDEQTYVQRRKQEQTFDSEAVKITTSNLCDT